MMLLSAIAAVLLAVVAKRRIGAARPNTPQEAHPEAHEAPPAAGTKRTMATIIADYDLDAENASDTLARQRSSEKESASQYGTVG